MRPHWIIAAHACELARPGDFVVLSDGEGCEIALTNIDGEVVSFDNLCPHRGARIFTQMRGNAEPRCRYHGRLARPEQMAREKVSARNGWIFVGEPGDEVALPDVLANFIDSAPALTLHSTLEFTMDCHWTVAIENALDFEHVPHVHAESLAALKLAKAASYTWGDGSSMDLFRSFAGLDKMSQFFPHEANFDYVHAHLFPLTCLSSTRGWTYSLQNYLPRADGRTQFIHRLYAAPTTRPMPQFFDSAAQMNERVFREDDEICAGIPENHASHLGPHESRIAHFRESRRIASLASLKEQFRKGVR